MADFDVDWLADFKDTCYGALEACTPKSLYVSSQINRLNWRERLDRGSLTLPWFAYSLLAQTEADDAVTPSAGNCFWQPVILYGVYSATDPNASINGNGRAPFDPVSWALSQAHSARKDLMQYGGANFAVLPGRLPLIDVSDECEPNRVFVTQQAQLRAFKLSCTLLVGTSFGVG